MADVWRKPYHVVIEVENRLQAMLVVLFFSYFLDWQN
jgi:hypothetical protein